MSIIILKKSALIVFLADLIIIIIFDRCWKLMLQNEELTNLEKHQLLFTITLLTEILTVDQYLLAALPPVPDPHYVFTQIIRTKMPSDRIPQQQTVVLLASCFYKMSISKDSNMQSLQIYFEKYLQIVQFMPAIVLFYQKIKKWTLKLQITQDLVTSKKELQQLLVQLAASEQPKLQLMHWRLSLCTLILSLLFKKVKVERPLIVSLIKRYNKLKGQALCMAVETTAKAFCFIIGCLLKQKNESFSFFQIELQKIYHKHEFQKRLQLMIQKQLTECSSYYFQNLSKGSLKPKLQTTGGFNNTQKTSANRGPIKLSHFHNQHQQEQNLKQTTLLPQKNIITRNLVNKKHNQETLFKSVDLFLTSRQSFHNKSISNSKPFKIKINPTQTQTVTLHQTSRMGWFTQKAKESTQITGSKKLGLRRNCSTGSAGSKKWHPKRRKQAYLQIKQKDKKNLGIDVTQLSQQMYSIQVIGFQRCKITLQQILIGQGKNTKDKDQTNIKFTGAAEDNEFGSMRLTFLIIFNQQFACLSMKIRKFGKQGYLVSCSTNSTFCRHSTLLKFNIGMGGSQRISSQATVEDIQSSVQNSTIYYEALQERVQRRVGMMQLQAMEQLFRERAGYQLSQLQLLKILKSVDLVQSQFFWYYTKSSYINGSRLQKRNQIQFEDLSAFAVSLGKFKSDYDSCLSEIVQVSNLPSLTQTCVYLSYGRLVVHRQFRSVKGKLFLEVISIAQQVYQSFKRVDKKPYFEHTILKRRLYNLDKNRIVKRGLTSIDLREVLAYEDVFIFFMKNIVQNFIQIKYIHRILCKLRTINMQENQQYLDQQKIIVPPDCALQIINNSEIQEVCDLKPLLEKSIINLRAVILLYCEVYHIEPKLQIQNKKKHIIQINQISYIAHEIALKNGLKIIKLHRTHTNSTYHLFLYHQQPNSLTIISTAFHSRVVISNAPNIIGNLIRNEQRQKLIAQDYLIVAKTVIKFQKGYCYVSISQCQYVMGWRLDLYFPLTQMHSATFFDQEIFLQCMSQWGSHHSIWLKCLNQLQINLQKQMVIIGSRQLKLFNCYRRMYFNEQILLGSIELIQIQAKLSYLITNFETQCLSIGQVEEMLFMNNRQVFSTIPSTKLKINSYNHVIVRLCKKIMSGKLPSAIIQIDYFQIEALNQQNKEVSRI